jgi:hypothetical protein
MRLVGVSRSTAWRYDKLFNREEAERAIVLERYAGHRDDEEDALREAADKDVELGVVPMPPDSWGRSQAKPSVEEALIEGDYPAGLLERRQRVQGERGLPFGHPMLRGSGVVVAHGDITESLPDEPLTGIMPW